MFTSSQNSSKLNEDDTYKTQSRLMNEENKTHKTETCLWAFSILITKIQNFYEESVPFSSKLYN